VKRERLLGIRVALSGGVGRVARAEFAVFGDERVAVAAPYDGAALEDGLRLLLGDVDLDEFAGDGERELGLRSSVMAQPSAGRQTGQLSILVPRLVPHTTNARAGRAFQGLRGVGLEPIPGHAGQSWDSGGRRHGRERFPGDSIWL